MWKKLVAGAACFVMGTWLMTLGAEASRKPRPPVPPTSSPPPVEAPPEVVSPPSEAASPPDVVAPPPLEPLPPEPAPPEPEPAPEVEEPPGLETPRAYAGVVTDPPLPAPAPPRPAPVRLPSTGAGDGALPLAGAALALGGLAVMAGAGQSTTRPAPAAGTVGLVHSDNAATPGPVPGGGDGGRRRGWRLQRRLGRR